MEARLPPHFAAVDANDKKLAEAQYMLSLQNIRKTGYHTERLLLLKNKEILC